MGVGMGDGVLKITEDMKTGLVTAQVTKQFAEQMMEGQEFFEKAKKDYSRMMEENEAKRQQAADRSPLYKVLQTVAANLAQDPRNTGVTRALGASSMALNPTEDQLEARGMGIMNQLGQVGQARGQSLGQLAQFLIGQDNATEGRRLASEDRRTAADVRKQDSASRAEDRARADYREALNDGTLSAERARELNPKVSESQIAQDVALSGINWRTKQAVEQSAIMARNQQAQSASGLAAQRLAAARLNNAKATTIEVTNELGLPASEVALLQEKILKTISDRGLTDVQADATVADINLKLAQFMEAQGGARARIATELAANAYISEDLRKKMAAEAQKFAASEKAKPAKVERERPTPAPRAEQAGAGMFAPDRAPSKRRIEELPAGAQKMLAALPEGSSYRDEAGRRWTKVRGYVVPGLSE